MNLNRIKQIFFVLILLVVGEIVYYFFILTQNSQNKNTPLLTNPTSILIPTLELKPELSENCLQKCSLLYPSPFPDQAIKELEFASLRALKKDILKSTLVQYTYEGTITKVEYGKFNDTPTVRFSIKSPSNNQNNFYYPQKPYLEIKDKTGTLNFNALKVGQHVKADVNYDILNGVYTKIALNIAE